MPSNKILYGVDEATLYQYERLSYFEQEEVKQWIEKNISQIPFPNKIKQSGLNGLLLENYSLRSTLSMIRYAMRELKIHPK